MINLEKLFENLEANYEEMVRLRRHFHKNPELSYQEKNTSKYIYNYFKDMDLKIEKVKGKYGLLITLNKEKSSKKVIALRSDFDALAIVEENNYDYKSTNPGVFHGCGHDSHTAYLMVLLKQLYGMRDCIDGCIKFIFQHAEESVPGGAIDFINQGLLDDVQAMYVIHNVPQVKCGNVVVSEGGMLAGVERFDIKITGKGGHGSNPCACIDPIVCAASFINSAQTIVSRNTDALDSVVLTFGKISSSGSYNIISDWVEINGDTRNLVNKTTKFTKKRLEEVLNATCTAYGCEGQINWLGGFPAVENSQEHVNILKKSIDNKIFDGSINFIDNVKAMGSEDASQYFLKIPGVYFGVGSMPTHQEVFYAHNPKFDINEKYMLTCAKIMGTILVTNGL